MQHVTQSETCVAAKNTMATHTTIIILITILWRNMLHFSNLTTSVTESWFTESGELLSFWTQISVCSNHGTPVALYTQHKTEQFFITICTRCEIRSLGILDKCIDSTDVRGNKPAENRLLILQIRKSATTQVNYDTDESELREGTGFVFQ